MPLNELAAEVARAFAPSLPPSSRSEQWSRLLGRIRGALQRLALRSALEQAVGRRGAEQLSSSLSGRGHFGFLAPWRLAQSQLGALAAEHGLAYGQSWFSSEILALELGRRCGRPRLDTEIFRADVGPTETAPWGLEVFFPQADPALLERWVAERVGTHLAFGLTSPEAVEGALRLGQEMGWRTPDLPLSLPWRHQASGMTLIYLDSVGPEGGFRWEFYCSESEVS